MRTLLKLEEVGLFALGAVLFSQLPYAWWVFPAFLLAPDLGMLGYLAGPSAGSVTYNLTHHRGLAGGFVAIGLLAFPLVALVGVIMFAHVSLDRVFGYGLKYPDSFHHTHLGWVGRGRRSPEAAV